MIDESPRVAGEEEARGLALPPPPPSCLAGPVFVREACGGGGAPWIGSSPENGVMCSPDD